MTHAPFLKWLIRGLVLAGVFLAAPSAGETPMPAPPAAPLLQEAATPCSSTVGVLKRVYDTDPGGPGAFIEFRLLRPSDPVGKVFLVILADPSGDDTKSRAYLALPGREIQILTMDLLIARYQAPCELALHIAGSPE